MANHWVRTMVPDDYPDVAHIDWTCFKESFTQDEIAEIMNSKRTRGLVVEVPIRENGLETSATVGYLFYDRCKYAVRVHRFAVVPNFRRRGMAMAMLWACMEDMNDERHRFTVDVNEANREACLLLKYLGLQSKLMRDMFHDMGQDGIRFFFDSRKQVPAKS